MNVRLLTARLLPLLATGFVLAATVATPLADIAVFGLHDHIAAIQASSAGQPGPAGAGDVQGSHHCDFWMSPADIALAVDLPVPPPAVFLPLDPAVFLIVAESLPSSPPPRA